MLRWKLKRFILLLGTLIGAPTIAAAEEAWRQHPSNPAGR
jgi:hypothetical protein